MCQIFWKPAGSTIDENKLITSVKNNPHGYGILYRDKPNGEGPWPFKCKKVCTEKDTDPEEILELMKSLEDKDVYLHLRYVTAGARDISNAHPFLVYGNEESHNQLFVMHNGTIYEYTPKNKEKDSDTKLFCENFVTPFVSLLKNPFKWDKPNLLSKVLEEEIGGFSRVFLISSHETAPLVANYSKCHVEKDKDKNFIKWIAANSYSFDPNHRKPKNTYASYYGSSNNSWIRYSGKSTNTVNTKNEAKSTVLIGNSKPPSTTKLETKEFISKLAAINGAKELEAKWKKYYNNVFSIENFVRYGKFTVTVYGSNPKIKETSGSIINKTKPKNETFDNYKRTKINKVRVWPPTKDALNKFMNDVQVELIYIPDKILYYYDIQSITDFQKFTNLEKLVKEILNASNKRFTHQEKVTFFAKLIDLLLDYDDVITFSDYYSGNKKNSYGLI